VGSVFTKVESTTTTTAGNDKWATAFRKHGRQDVRAQKFDDSDSGRYGDYEDGHRGGGYPSSRGQSNRYDDGMDDRRFANKFSSGGSRNGSAKQSLSNIPTVENSQADKKKAVKLDAVKKAKVEAEARAEAQFKSENEVVRRNEVVKREAKAKEDKDKVLVVVALRKSGDGKKLLKDFKELSKKEKTLPTAASLVALILPGLNDKLSCDWVIEYGPVFRYVVFEDFEE
jgi:hypothetical protein